MLEEGARTGGVAWLEIAKTFGLAAAALTVLGGWAIGRLNNALAVDLKVRRKPSSNPRYHDAVVELTLKKGAPTRVRVTKVAASIHGVSRRQRTAFEVEEQAISRALARSLRPGPNGIVLVAQDATRYEAHLRLRADDVVEVSVELTGAQLLVNWIQVGTPWWTASAVSVPADAGAPPSPVITFDGEDTKEAQTERDEEPDDD